MLSGLAVKALNNNCTSHKQLKDLKKLMFESKRNDIIFHSSFNNFFFFW